MRLAGELDLYNAADVTAALEELAADSPSRVIIDLSEVAFVDSTALGTLVEARRQMGQSGLVLVAPGHDVARALEVSGARPALHGARLGRRRARPLTVPGAT